MIGRTSHRYEYEYEYEMTTTTTMNTALALWFHDAEIEDAAPCDAAEQDKQHAWGVCLECGDGLDDESEFLVDRRQKTCECYTCDQCFVNCFGMEAFNEAVSWQTLGMARPQYARFCFAGK